MLRARTILCLGKRLRLPVGEEERETLQGVISDLEIRLEQTEGQIESEPLPTVNADRLQMRQLMQNLIGNA
ncbi:MAG: hypothetical protein P8X98_17075, partial [Woeseiaceae bacterium]